MCHQSLVQKKKRRTDHWIQIETCQLSAEDITTKVECVIRSGVQLKMKPVSYSAQVPHNDPKDKVR